MFPSEIKDFTKNEFDCPCGCGKNNIDYDFVKDLQTARTIAKTSFVINRGCSCEFHNLRVDGSADSSHLIGKAVDIRCLTSTKRYKIVQALLFCGFKRIGVYEKHIHVDSDETKPQKVIWCV